MKRNSEQPRSTYLQKVQTLGTRGLGPRDNTQTR